MSAKEIITLQLGHYANFVGTHWWNIQESTFEYEKSDQKKEEINHDVLFREGITDRGEVTFTPRLVLTELRGGLGGLRADSGLYDDCNDGLSESLTWDGKTDIYRQPPFEKNEYLKDLDSEQESIKQEATNGHGISRSYNLEKDVKVWSDYLRTYLHPKSSVIVNDYHHDSPNNPFDLWAKGTCLSSVIDELEEKIRFYAEECDSLQGFHIIVDSCNGFSGLASSLLPYLHDEFSSKDSVSFPVRPAKYTEDSVSKSNTRNLNLALLLPVLMGNSSLVNPLSLESDKKQDKLFPGLIYDVNLDYHTSAILASALDSITLNHRLKGSRGVDLDGFCNQAAVGTKNLVCSSLSMPFPLHRSNNLEDVNTILSNTATFTAITPNICTDLQAVVECYSHTMSMRGLSAAEMLIRKGRSPFNPCEFSDVIEAHFAAKYPGCKRSCHFFTDCMKTEPPFPQFFISENTKAISQGFQNGHSNSSPRINGHEMNGVSNNHAHINGIAQTSSKPRTVVPVLAALECTSRAMGIFGSAATTLNISKSKYSVYGLEAENMESEIEYLLTMRDEYKPDVSNGWDTDEDI